jgi:glycerol-3-phosphate dehydrogenase
MAAEVVDRVAKELARPAGLGRHRSKEEPLPGGEVASSEGFRGPGLELGLPGATVEHLLRQYGSETPAIYTLCRERPALAERLHPEHPAIAAQVVFAVRREFAVTSDDILERRIRLVHETVDRGQQAHARVARLLAEAAAP